MTAMPRTGPEAASSGTSLSTAKAQPRPRSQRRPRSIRDTLAGAPGRRPAPPIGRCRGNAAPATVAAHRGMWPALRESRWCRPIHPAGLCSNYEYSRLDRYPYFDFSHSGLRVEPFVISLEEPGRASRLVTGPRQPVTPDGADRLRDIRHDSAMSEDGVFL